MNKAKTLQLIWPADEGSHCQKSLERTSGLFTFIVHFIHFQEKL